MRPFIVPDSPKTVDGRVVRVPREVLRDMLTKHTLDQLNAMPYTQRLRLADEAMARIRARLVGGAGNDVAARLREERRQRKAEQWAKRQPKDISP